jgi:hypothetical protein
MELLKVSEISQSDLLEILQMFDGEDKITEDDLANIICEDSITIKLLKDISKEIKVIIGDKNELNYILIEIIDNSSILCKAIIDLDAFPFEENSRFFDSISFATWLGSLEKEVYDLSNEDNITTIKFKSSSKLELSIPIKCKTIQEGYEKLNEMVVKVNEISENIILSIVDKFDLQKTIDK